MIKQVFKTVAAICALAFGSNVAIADPVAGTYDVSDSVTDCSGAPHGLWTNSLMQGACGNFFSATDMTMVLTDDGAGGLTGALTGTATNPFDIVAEFDLLLTGWCDSLDDALCAGKGYKQENGGPENADVQDYFAELSGTITIIEEIVPGVIISNPYEMSIFAHTAQLGLGANAKNQNFGFSTWMTASLGEPLPDHWDINVDLTIVPTQVPEPGTLALLGLGLLGLGTARRRRTVA